MRRYFLAGPYRNQVIYMYIYSNDIFFLGQGMSYSWLELALLVGIRQNKAWLLPTNSRRRVFERIVRAFSLPRNSRNRIPGRVCRAYRIQYDRMVLHC